MSSTFSLRCITVTTGQISVVTVKTITMQCYHPKLKLRENIHISPFTKLKGKSLLRFLYFYTLWILTYSDISHFASSIGLLSKWFIDVNVYLIYELLLNLLGKFSKMNEKTSLEWTTEHTDISGSLLR